MQAGSGMGCRLTSRGSWAQGRREGDVGTRGEELRCISKAAAQAMAGGGRQAADGETGGEDVVG